MGDSELGMKNIDKFHWPVDERVNMSRGGRYRQASAICEEGHQYTRSMSWMEETYVPNKCPECGANVLTGCRGCDLRIPGELVGGNLLFTSPPNTLPYFCEDCGAMYPWAGKEQKIYELKNRLRLEGLEEADFKEISEQLEKLKRDDLSSEDEKRVWAKVKEKAGAVLSNEGIMDLMLSIAGKVLKDQY